MKEKLISEIFSIHRKELEIAESACDYLLTDNAYDPQKFANVGYPGEEIAAKELVRLLLENDDVFCEVFGYNYDNPVSKLELLSQMISHEFLDDGGISFTDNYAKWKEKLNNIDNLFPIRHKDGSLDTINIRDRLSIMLQYECQMRPAIKFGAEENRLSPSEFLEWVKERVVYHKEKDNKRMELSEQRKLANG